MIITSVKNERIKYAVKLRDRKFRERGNHTILEGYRAITRAFENGIIIKECFYCPEIFLGGNENTLLAKLTEKNVEIQEVTPCVIEKMAYRDRPEGLIAVAVIREHLLDKLPVRENGLYIIAEAIEKPGNLGSILRSADAAGVRGVIVCDKCTDIYNPNVITASTGAVFTVPIAETDSKTAAEWLKKHNIKTLAATPHAEKIYTDVDMTLSTAIIVGTEQYGLSRFWLDRADLKIKIPMLGMADSLNVATATTILLFEAARQRKWRGEIS